MVGATVAVAYDAMWFVVKWAKSATFLETIYDNILPGSLQHLWYDEIAAWSTQMSSEENAAAEHN